ncbi:MAG: cytochrome c biogenesis protein CcsA [Saprospiraceae bacterium]|nr:cytochrome c biogenesis protein CcsA [Saprospiraceae bacterium]
MNEVEYIGEHLWIGQVGHFSIVLAFVASILSAIAYSINARNENYQNSWRSLGRIGYILHGIGIFTVVGLLFYGMYHKFYEYAYVFQHVSDDLPLRYTLSAFWEGQEGSFMLWMMWHIVLGWFLIYRGSKWESPVMAIIAMSEIFLTSMILGVHIEIGDWMTKFGSNPTLLLRDTLQAPIFNNADYVSLISGDGLNPLLQNYWMTIHPPVTFLGFASTIVPFAFAVAGLWTGKYKEWLKPALPWALFSAGILGTGIVMGSVWAYEALSFGGYWSWDPVENAVLVPWLFLIAGLHTHLIAKSTGYSIKATIFFYGMAFPLIVYSTFLTRSGILGDTSAHAFTEMGLEKQLIAFFVFFFAVGLGALAYHSKKIPSKDKEESIYSREFWMFIGSLVLLFSAILIGVPTSFPVFNSIISYFDESYVGRVIQDPVPFYNKFQIWIAVFMGLLSGLSILLRYNEKNWEKRSSYYLKRFGGSGVLSIIATFLLTLWFDLHSWQFYLLSITSFFIIFTNLDYLFFVLKGNLKLGSSALAHFGFGVMIIGLLGSGLNKDTISTNPFLFKDMFEPEDLKNYVQLIKDKPLFSQGYWITYESDTLIGKTRLYDLDFKKLDEDKKIIEQFKLRPNSVYSNDFQKVAAFNPDTKHYLDKDIFSCIVSLAPTKMDLANAKAFEDTLVWNRHIMTLGDTLRTEFENWFVINSISYQPKHSEFKPEDNDFGVEVSIQAGNDRYDKTFEMKTALGLQGALLYKYPHAEEDLGVRVRLADDFIENIFNTEDQLDYQDKELSTYGSFQFEGAEIKLIGFNKAPENRNYEPQEGDIAVGAKMMVIQDGQSYPIEPIFIIRGASPMGVKGYVPELGIHVRFVAIDPANETFSFKIAKDTREKNISIPLEITEDVPRGDYVILQAQIFPGINLLWLGCILMMLGLFMAWIIRMKNNKF